MKWIMHQTGAILAASALAIPLPGIAAAWAGAVAPDWIDQAVCRMLGAPGKRQKIFNRIHRGTTHWLGWWLASFCIALALPLPAPLFALCIGFALGGVSHVILDMLTPQGVPVWPFSRKCKLSLPLCSTGKPSEYVFLAFLLIAAAFFWKEEIRPVLELALAFLQ